MKNAPTACTYKALDAAYDHFNRTLFNGELPTCLITMQRHKGAYGYFHSNRFGRHDSPDQTTDEIALNPAGFSHRTPTEILSTLVHEMAHLWQHHFGRPSRNGYHNGQWASKMIEIGLIPTDTGKPDGKPTGQKVTHIIAKAGKFADQCKAFLAAHDTPLYTDLLDETTRRKKKASKTKYTCPSCGLNAWAKPDVNLTCTDCQEPMVADE